MRHLAPVRVFVSGLTTLLLLGTSFAGSGSANNAGSNKPGTSMPRGLVNRPHQFDGILNRWHKMMAEGRKGKLENKTNFKLNNGPKPFVCMNDTEECGEEIGEGPNATQSETALAIDPTGMHVVIGFNDFRGFNVSPASVSGYAYSDDGGLTFTDGGQLPGVVGGQVSGDPDIKYVPGGTGCQFIYASILVNPAGKQTMSLHRSTDCGHTWQGPFEILPATTPVTTGDAADKEFIDVDPETGRVAMSWTNFSTKREIRVTYSDNVMTATPPTWSTGQIINTASLGNSFDSGSMPRFAGNGSSDLYVTWGRSSATLGTPYSGFSATTIAFARSVDNGVTFLPQIDLASYFYPIDYIVGNDRVHSFPSMAVDNSSGPNAGNIYVVAVTNNSGDGGDIGFWRSTDHGVTFSPTVLLNEHPGTDRAQWFPTAVVDPVTGRLSVTYYDQGVSPSGDVMQTMWIYSDNGGLTWSKPSFLMSGACVSMDNDKLNCRSFHGGYGNDTGQPNLGDYNATAALGGTFYAVWAATPRVVPFTDGQPNGSFNSPDFYFNKVTAPVAAINMGSLTFTDSGGNGLADAGDQLKIKIPLQNYTTNPISSPAAYTGVTGTLSTTTPKVTIARASSSYPDIAAGASQTNNLEYVVQIAPDFVPGTKIEFALNVATGQGSTKLLFTQNTGTPVVTTVLSENFDGVTAPALPAGWGTIHQGGANTVPWKTDSTFCRPAGSPNNGLFHANANDGVGGTGNPTRFERVASPNLSIPASSDYVTLDFDICYDTEDAPDFNVLGYDGALIRITDFTPGNFARAELAEAFAETITTDSIFHYPKHSPRSNSTAYFQDMSFWSGQSNGFKHVSMRLPGMAGATVQLRPDFTQDSGGTCNDAHPGASTRTCGVVIDNIVMNSVKVTSNELLKITLTPTGVPRQFTGKVTSQPIAPVGGITVNLSSSNPGATTMPASVVIPSGSQNSPTFTVTFSAAGSYTITATGPSNARSAGVVTP